MNVLIYLIDLVESNSSIKQRQECNSFKIVNSEFFLNKNAGGLDRMRPVGIKIRFVGHLQGLVYSTFLQLLFYPRKCNRGLGFGNNDLPQHTQTSCHSTSSRRCKDCYLKLFGIYNKIIKIIIIHRTSYFTHLHQAQTSFLETCTPRSTHYNKR